MGIFLGKAVAFVAGSWFGKMILSFFYDKLKDYIGKIKEDKRVREEIRKEVEASFQKMVDAKTGEEIDKAADSALDHF